ncbi:MAG: hypothetical protein GQ477_05690 [Nanohaloarchaea archaeon]|nr:hypothetical protein [Candidatus Nanohaloarchaea archaeon]
MIKTISENTAALKKDAERKYKSRHLRTTKILMKKITPTLILVVIITLFIKFSITLTPGQEHTLMRLDQLIIFLFASDLLIDYILSYSKIEFLKKRWFSILLFLPLLNSLGRVGTGVARAAQYSEILSTTEKTEGLFKMFETDGLNPAFKTGHITNLSARLARSSVILEKLREI